MTLLDCNVNNCLYNDSNLCCKNNIEVAGDEARSSDCTCCDSFHERQKDSFSNSVGEPSRPTNVSCEAEKCVYNENLLCAADQIGIMGTHAHATEETQCATFKPR